MIYLKTIDYVLIFMIPLILTLITYNIIYQSTCDSTGDRDRDRVILLIIGLTLPFSSYSLCFFSILCLKKMVGGLNFFFTPNNYFFLLNINIIEIWYLPLILLLLGVFLIILFIGDSSIDFKIKILHLEKTDKNFKYILFALIFNCYFANIMTYVLFVTNLLYLV